MPWTQDQLKTLPPKARQFWTKAFDFIRENNTEWFLVANGTEQHKAWARYFAQQGWKPFAIDQLETGKCQQITMPAEWPEWFEPDLAKGPAKILEFQHSLDERPEAAE